MEMNKGLAFLNDSRSLSFPTPSDVLISFFKTRTESCMSKVGSLTESCIDQMERQIKGPLKIKM